MRRREFCLGTGALTLGCSVRGPIAPGTAPGHTPAIAIHGGAGTIPKTLPTEVQEAYRAGLGAALKLGIDWLRMGGRSLDAVERVVRTLEDNPLFNAGRGAVYTHDGSHELDAAIMDGRTLACGAVTGLRTVKNPISLARLVMERTRHVFLSGVGAEAFADRVGVERVPSSYFDTKERFDAWQKALAKGQAALDLQAPAPGGSGIRDRGVRPAADKYGTVGCAALDQYGNLAAATSTGGLTNKLFGRVGDVPVIGAGTYANNWTCAISCTGIGEEFIRLNVAHDVSSLIEYRGVTLEEAAGHVIHKKLKPGDGGLIGVGRDGSIALVFNSEGMYRGAADAKGRFEVNIW